MYIYLLFVKFGFVIESWHISSRESCRIATTREISLGVAFRRLRWCAFVLFGLFGLFDLSFLFSEFSSYLNYHYPERPPYSHHSYAARMWVNLDYCVAPPLSHVRGR